jgi:hypothetical protein
VNINELNLIGGAMILVMVHISEKFLLHQNNADVKLPGLQVICKMFESVLIILGLWCALSGLMVLVSLLLGDVNYTLTSLLYLVKKLGFQFLIASPGDFKEAAIDGDRYLAGLSALATGVMGYCGLIGLLNIKKLLKALKLKDSI